MAHDEKFLDSIENYRQDLVSFIKQLISIHLYMKRNSTLETKNGITDRLLSMQQQVVQGKLDEVSLDYGVKEAAEKLAVSELINLSYLFSPLAVLKDTKIKFESVYENIAVQYCVFLAITKNIDGVFSGDFKNYVEDAYQESYFMIGTFFDSFVPSIKELKEGESPDEDLYWKFLFFTKRMLPSKIRHWYLKEMKRFRYNRKPKGGQKKYEKVVVTLDGNKPKKKGCVGSPNTIVDKYGAKLGDLSYSELIQLVSEGKNPTYAYYIDKHFNEDKTYGVIAIELETKEATVKSGVNRGLAYLRKKFNVS